MRLATVLICSASLWAQSGVNRPFVGEMLDRQHLLRPVYGAAGSFHVEAPVAERVIASACSRTFCLAKTESALVGSDTTAAAPHGDAKIALDATGATIYFPQTGQFARWQNGALTTLSLSIDGTVLSLRSSPLNIAVERSGTIWIVAADGSILDSLPANATAVILLSDSAIYATSDSLVLRKADGSELRFPAPSVTSLMVLGDSYVEAVAGQILYGLRTSDSREQLFQLPQTEELRR